jgi:glycine cleavage system aminomethyltransferase T
MAMQFDPFEHVPKLPHSSWTPLDYRVNDYYFIPPFIHPSTFGDWQTETLSWKESCYIFAGLNLTPSGYATGPDVIKLLSDCTTNSHARFPVGKIKHSMLTDENGNIIMHGLVHRLAEDKVWITTIYPWVVAAADRGNYDVKFDNTQMTRFIFQLGGPRTLEALEAATGENLHDIPFLGFKESHINGKNVHISRMTMAGTLGYEVHGDTQDAYEIYDAILNAGKPFGMRRIGWLAYAANVAEGGMPQETVTFTSAARENQFFMEGLRKQGYNTDLWPGHPRLLGSSAAAGDIRKYYRNPIELNWDVSVTFDHDFPGKTVLQALKANPKRRTVTLKWNAEDVVELLASYYQSDAQPYKWVNYPVHIYKEFGLEQDDVYDKSGNIIGYSASATYTLYSRSMLSLGTVDVDYTKIGTEVEVLWGNPGQPQKRIRATVEKYPYLDLPDNMHFDVASIPHINK